MSEVGRTNSRDTIRITPFQLQPHSLDEDGKHAIDCRDASRRRSAPRLYSRRRSRQTKIQMNRIRDRDGAIEKATSRSSVRRSVAMACGSSRSANGAAADPDIDWPATIRQSIQDSQDGHSRSFHHATAIQGWLLVSPAASTAVSASISRHGVRIINRDTIQNILNYPKRYAPLTVQYISDLGP